MQVAKFLILVVKGSHLDLVEGFGFDLVGDFSNHYSHFIDKKPIAI